MVYAKKQPDVQEYRALVNLSIGTVERGVNGREERADRVERGSKVFLTSEQATNFGRFVRLVSDEESAQIPRITPKDIVGKNINKLGFATVEGTGALDMTNTTRVIMSETEADESAQPTNNPIDPAYTG